MTIKQHTTFLNNHSYEWIMDYEYEIRKEISQLFVCVLIFPPKKIQFVESLDDDQPQGLFGLWKKLRPTI